jgi:hypothetical protein
MGRPSKKKLIHYHRVLTEKTRSLGNPEEAVRQRGVDSAAAAATTKLHDSGFPNQEHKSGDQKQKQTKMGSSSCPG